MSMFRLAAAIAGLSACVSATNASAQTPPPDLVYSRIKPCRAFDTTKTQKIPANSAKSFLISGDGNFAAQGGTAAGCGVPPSAQAVSINLTALNGAAAGSLAAMPYAQTTSTTTVRYPVSAPETVGGIVDLLQNKLTVRTTNTVNVLGDVTGYYAPRVYALIGSDGTIFDRTAPVVSVTVNAFSNYTITLDRNVSRCRGYIIAPLPFHGNVNIGTGNIATVQTVRLTEISAQNYSSMVQNTSFKFFLDC